MSSVRSNLDRHVALPVHIFSESNYMQACVTHPRTRNRVTFSQGHEEIWMHNSIRNIHHWTTKQRIHEGGNKGICRILVGASFLFWQIFSTFHELYILRFYIPGFLPRDSLAKNEILHSEYTTVVACSTQPRIYIEVLADNRASNPAREKCKPPASGDSFVKILNMNRLKFNVIYTLCTNSAHEPSNCLYKMNHNCKLSTEQRRCNFVTARNGMPEGYVFIRVCLSTGGRGVPRWPLPAMA